MFDPALHPRDLRGRFVKYDPDQAYADAEAYMAEVMPTPYTYVSEGIIDGVEYVTVLDRGGNPIEYNYMLTEHPQDCLFCRSGEPMRHQYEPPQA